MHLVFLITYLLLVNIPQSLQIPFINSGSDNILCTYSFSDSDMNFTNALWETSYQDKILKYSLCEPNQQEIGCKSPGYACLFDKNTANGINIGRSFVPDDESDDLVLKSIDGDVCTGNKKYSVKIHFECSESTSVTPKLELINKCEYKITMMTPDCTPQCTTRVGNLLIDLRHFKTSIRVISGDRKFSFKLCGVDRNCRKPGISGCEIITNDFVPLITKESQHVYYNKDQQELSVRGKYKLKAGRVERNFKMILTCNFETDMSNVSYKAVSTQGKKYEFRMESSFGCVKLPQDCMVKSFDGVHEYNLTKLYRESGFWTVKNTRRSAMFMNICGALKLSRPNNLCDDKYSQICEIKNNEYISRGSIFSNFMIEDDKIMVDVLYGSPCADNITLKDSTRIEFECSSSESGPTFIRNENCTTFLHWRTPAACPTYVKNVCGHMHFQKNNNCSFTNNNNYYNLNPISRQIKIADQHDSKISYSLNLCSSVMESEAPCTTNAMVMMTNMTEVNVKYRYKALAFFTNPKIENNKIFIEAVGAACDNGIPYHTEIALQCSSIEEKPKLVLKENCKYKFLWKTKYACPVLLRNSRDCKIDKEINFSDSENTQLNLNIDNSTYKLDFCEDTIRQCTRGACVKHFVVREISPVMNKTSIQMTLKRACSNSSVFNKIVFIFTCDPVKNNEHFENRSFDNCTIYIDYKTFKACSTEKVTPDESKNTINHLKNEVFDVADHTDKTILKNCSLINQHTGYTLDLYKLNLAYVPSNCICPKMHYNYTNDSVKLDYNSKTQCLKNNNFNDVYITEVYLICAKISKEYPTLKDGCKEVKKYDVPEVCKVFTQNLQRMESRAAVSSVTLWVVGVVLVLIGSCCVLVYFKRSQVQGLYRRIYIKDGIL